MIALSTALRSSLGKKYLMGLTGLVWLGFAVGHLIGNLLLLVSRQAFNDYAHFLETIGHGALLPFVEAFLVLALLTHVYTGLTVAWADKSRARPRGYEVSGNARNKVRPKSHEGDGRGHSQKTLASQTMAWSGLLLLVFLVFHVLTFKYGVVQPTSGGAYLAPGAKDLYARVVNAFANPVYVGFYTLIMLMLGTHLSHGVWSAFQSLGLNTPRFMRFIRPFAYVLAILLALGFLFLPMSIFVFNQKFSSPHGGLLG